MEAAAAAAVARLAQGWSRDGGRTVHAWRYSRLFAAKKKAAQERLLGAACYGGLHIVDGKGVSHPATHTQSSETGSTILSSLEQPVHVLGMCD